MTISLRQFTVATLFLSAATAVFAQPSIDPAAGRTLEELTALALEQAPEMLAARAGIDAARGQLRQAALRPNPTLTIGRREEPGGSDSQTSVMLQVPLDLFRREGRVSTATETITAVEFEVADRERLLASAVRERAGRVLLAARMTAIVEDLVTVTRRIYDLLAARVAEGATPPIDRDVAHVELQRLEAEHLTHIAEVRAALVELKALVGMSPDAGLALRDDLEQQVRQDGAVALPAAAIDGVVAERPDVREADARIRVADARIGQLQREGRFDLGIYGTYMRMNAGFPQRGFSSAGALERVRGVFQYAEAGGMLMLPLFNRNQGAVAAAEAEKRGAERTRAARELAGRAEIVAASTRDVELRKAVELFARARELARRNVEVVRESYQLGRNTLFEVFAEQRRLLETETAYAEALARAFDARTTLLAATGARP